MPQSIGSFTILVRDYDEALSFYAGSLGFHIVEDTPLSESKRWVLVAPPGSQESRILLAKADTPSQVARIGDQTGGRVAFFLHTDAFDRDYARMQANGVHFLEEPRSEPYGTVVVFSDLYGNLWDLIQPVPR
jgi:catechol 2,3-dioxygenase-like lactoylglutathione lyase family enzyme